jgi:type IV secretory pathway VirB4 component
MMPIYDFRTGTGKVPFLTPTRSLVLYDPFDTRVLPNANILVTGTSGAGKSFLVSLLVSGYEIGAAAQGEPPPYVFILDNGASYKRYAELRPDGRYVLFGFDRPPGVDPFAWSAEEGDLDEHVSRLEWLLLDLLHVDPSEEERFERVKAVLEAALYSLYASGGEASFAGLGNALEALGRPEAEALTASLYPFVRGKFRRLCEASRDLEMTEDVHLLCYDFHGLAEHRDLASLALRLAIYQVRRWAARVSRKGHRTFLVLDESWALLDAASGGAIAGTAAPFIAASVRMGRKEGMSVVGLSQVIEDFAQSAYGAAIVGNSATKFVGQPGGEGVEGLRRHLRLTDRQVDQVRRLKRTQRFHEFLLMQGDLTHVVRVPGDPLSRWIFTTSPRDRERLAALAKSRPDLSLLEQVRLLAASGEA